MDDLLEFLPGILVDGAMDAVDSPGFPCGRGFYWVWCCWRSSWGSPFWSSGWALVPGAGA